MKIVVTIIPTNLVTDSLLSLFSPFKETIKQKFKFKQVDGLATKNIFVF